MLTLVVLSMMIFALEGVEVMGSEDGRECRMDNFQVQPNFQVKQFLGKWYELTWIPENWFPPEYNFRDFIHIYTQVNETFIDVFGQGRKRADSPDCFSYHDGLVVTETPGKFYYDRVYNSTARFMSDYWVVLTDYDNYALVFGCRGRDEAGVCALPDAWLWSRSTTLSDEHMERVNSKIEELCLRQSQFMVTDHDNECPIPADL